jgi:hypothetical protein
LAKVYGLHDFDPLRLEDHPIYDFAATPGISSVPGTEQALGKLQHGSNIVRRTGSAGMPSVIEDFAFIAKRAQEIRVARYHELGVSDPIPPAAPQTVPNQAVTDGGFRYAPGFEHLAAALPDDATS